MELITLKRFDNTIDAHLLMSKLEHEGIPSVIFDENMVSLNPLYAQTLGGIKLKIHEYNLDAALQVLSDLEQIGFQDENGEVIKCPNCKSSKLYTGFKSMKGFAGVLSAIMSLLLMIYPFYYDSLYRCKKCHTEFKN